MKPPSLLTIAGFILLTLHAETERPNILFILTDDQGWPTLGAFGGEIVPTPNLDKLADNGAILTDFYVTSQCTPTRASFMTGQYTARHGLWHVLGWYGYPWAKVQEPAYSLNYARTAFTVSKGLKAAGYRTGIIGKWHLTNNEDGYYDHLFPHASHYYGFDHSREKIPKSIFEYDRGVEMLTNQAIEFIEDSKETPWFCFLSHHMIHGKVFAPEKLVKKYENMGYSEDGPFRATYLAGLEQIDIQTGRLINYLENEGLLERTLIIFTSDNGGIDTHFQFPIKNPVTEKSPRIQTRYREYPNDPLRMGKGSGYEGGIRVPFIAHLPSRIPAGQVINTPAHIIDMMPTFFELTGAQAPMDHTLDGISLIDILAGNEPTDERAIFQYYPFYDLRWALTPSASIRKGKYKLIEFYGDQVDDSGQFHEGYKLELYDLQNDLGETHNLADEEPETVEYLKTELHQWMHDIGAEIPQLNPHFDPLRRLDEVREMPDFVIEQYEQSRFRQH